MTQAAKPASRTGGSIDQYIRYIGWYYFGTVVIMTLLIGATYQTVRVALDRHTIQQEISFLTSRQFVLFQQMANQTRAVMRASADPNIVEYIIEPILADVRESISDIRSTMDELNTMRQRLNSNFLEMVSEGHSDSDNLYLDLDMKLEEFLSRAETVVNASHEDRRRRYSFWGPIDFAISTDSVLMRQFNEVIQHTHDRSGASIGNAVIIITIPLLLLATVFVLASALLFRPMLNKLRRENTRKVEFERELSHLVHTDALTSLRNRSYFNRTLKALFDKYRTSGAGFSLLLVDLDYFKMVNDSFGHPAGDAILRHVADVAIKASRADDVVARLGGDEFALLLPDVVDENTLTTIADRLIKSIGEAVLFEGRTIRISASIGGALVPAHGTDEACLIRHADLALYTAKTGRNQTFIFDDKTLAARLEQSELLASLAGAASRDEFVVHYQPKVSLTSGTHLGFEALVRWQHPTLGLLPPGRFLPLMEDPKLINDMTRAVARNTCRDIRSWKDAGLAPGAVAINLPEILLVNGNGFDFIDCAIEDYGLCWGDVSVEVTEDVFLDRYADYMQDSMTRFRERGVSIALDDFGTGFASLLHLRDFPFDELKLDRSFISDVGQDIRSEQIIRAMIDLSRNLGKRCVAEGIETSTQRDFLVQAGCEIGQGYLFAKPMPAVEVQQRLTMALQPDGRASVMLPGRSDRDRVPTFISGAWAPEA